MTNKAGPTTDIPLTTVDRLAVSLHIRSSAKIYVLW